MFSSERKITAKIVMYYAKQYLTCKVAVIIYVGLGAVLLINALS